jgi:putative flippase GtrA
MARYLIVGVANTVVGLAVILLLQSVAGLSPYAANAGGYICGILLGFALNRGWTFRSDGSYGSTASRYVLVFGVCYALNLATLLVATHWLHWPAALAQAVSLSVYSITFFCLCRNVVFGSPEESISKLRRKRDQ